MSISAYSAAVYMISIRSLTISNQIITRRCQNLHNCPNIYLKFHTILPRIMLLGNSNLWLNLREIQINSVLLIGQLELFITKNRLYPVLFFKRYCFQLSPRKTHCKFDPRVLGHPVYIPGQNDQAARC
jgi:hypothetical protein